MKKTYNAPTLTSHGSVSQLTGFTFDFSAGDILFGQTDASNQGGTGSLNACVQKNGVCVNPNANGM
jgi:hypothetical protein